MMGQGDLVGLEGLDGGSLDHDAITMDHVSVCRIPKSTIDALRRDAPELHANLLKRWQKALTSANHWITSLSTGTAKQRVARLLILLHDTSLDDSFFLPTRDDMGAMLGITTESASKVIAEFKRNGLLRVINKKRGCIDLDELQAVVD
jgi:CRP-like cAMP-binding protein